LKNYKVFDCFTFFNELDILEIRLNTLDPLIDYFVINESPSTFNGVLKPLYYYENRERYEKFWPKIIHHVISDYPTTTGVLSNDPVRGYIYNRCVNMCNKADWFPKDYQTYFSDTWSKESLFYSLYGNCDLNDIIMLSDADEIPNPNTLKYIFDNFENGKVYNLEQNWYHYYFNLRKKQQWLGNMILDYGTYLGVGTCELKMKRRGYTIKNAGWHFSYVGNFDKIIEKLDSGWEHTWDVPLYKNNLKDNIDNALVCGHDLHFWPSKFEIADINTMPQYIQNNVDKFNGLLK